MGTARARPPSSSCAAADVVDLQPELHRHPLPLRLEHGIDVRVEVVDAPLGLVLERPDRPGLPEVVDVLGEPDLVDAARGGRLDEPLDRLDRVRDPLLRVAQMHVVVDDHADAVPPSHDSTSARSAAVVTFSSRGSPSTTFTRPPRPSTSAEQSVASVAAGDGLAQHRRDERLRRLHRGELAPRQRLHDRPVLHPLDRVGEREPGHRPVPALVQRRQQALDHRVGDERPRRVVDEDHRSVLGDLPHADPHRLGPRRTAGDRRDHLPGARAPRRAGSPAPPSRAARRRRSSRSTADASSRSRLSASNGRPRRAARTPLGDRLAPSRSPRPAAARTAQTDTLRVGTRARRWRPQRRPWWSSSCRSPRRSRGRRRARRRPRPRPSPWRT